jgi:hypothetical protein
VQRHGFAKSMVLRAGRGCDRWIRVTLARDSVKQRRAVAVRRGKRAGARIR